MIPRPPISTLFPYTTLFRSGSIGATWRQRNWGRSMRDCWSRSEEHTSELQSHSDLVCRLLLAKKNVTNARAIFLNDTSPTDIYTLSLHDALPIWINWRDMETEELGSVYEGLLE